MACVNRHVCRSGTGFYPCSRLLILDFRAGRDQHANASTRNTKLRRTGPVECSEGYKNERRGLGINLSVAFGTVYGLARQSSVVCCLNRLVDDTLDEFLGYFFR